ncbi:hypothetical protein VW35_16960 [Devosia soli]|uniref:Uncharacterized protein n=2 Tax=Devosia soli TaxID=361041 RepID=A0A0F5L288_9HYPH|nr:hypothetical protein VW35_16960 [Devosia soli]
MEDHVQNGAIDRPMGQKASGIKGRGRRTQNRGAALFESRAQRLGEREIVFDDKNALALEIHARPPVLKRLHHSTLRRQRASAWIDPSRDAEICIRQLPH